MIGIGQTVTVEVNGVATRFIVYGYEREGAEYAHASPQQDCEQLLVNQKFDYPESLQTEQARTEFHDMCVLMAAASKLFPNDSFKAASAAQQMRCTLRRDNTGVVVSI